jgi:hypothetical protein
MTLPDACGTGALGSATWTTATTLSATAGAGGAPGGYGYGPQPGTEGNGGNSGLVILTYSPPDGVCRL